MLTVTPVAAKRLDALLRTTGKTSESVIRMVRKNRRFRLEIDAVHGGDVVFAYHGRAVLVLDDRVSQSLFAGHLDVHKVDGQPRLTLKRTGRRGGR